MPQAPHPDECDTEVGHIRRMAAYPEVTEEGRARLIAYAEVRYFFSSHAVLYTIRSWVAED
jgi:hypothetical protein